ncbi:hypothetical protein BKA65DRAFT_228383 [Rhexocercosporidium sp. MPI-PUGE-AT-0058]|nr:hypothetical protein BKA65DRAFT_228383 [Rhexocercosporidium sp. MPI-PUGE-AT-0058]
MAEPLSVAASVGGLLTATQMASVGISKLLSSKQSGPKEILEVKMTIDTLRPVVQQVQLLLSNQAKIDPERAAMILFEEIAWTLTDLVETLSDLGQCIKGLEAEQNFGWLDSMKWLSRADDLKGYWQKLERGKTSLILMISILTNKSSHATKTAVTKLRVVVVEGVEGISERLARLERMLAMPDIHEASNDSGRCLRHETASARDATVTVSTNPKIHPALGYTFDDDLQTSWVYMRAKAHATRPFSVASSAQLTQSWSMLSGRNLSKISNIAIQALPIFEADIHNSNLHSFGGTEIGEQLATSPLSIQKHKRNVSGSWRAQIRSRLTQSGAKLTLTTQAGSNVETTTLPKGLRLLGLNPTAGKKPINKWDISDPIVHTLPGQASEWLPTVPAGPGSSDPSAAAKSSVAAKADARIKVPSIETDLGEVGISPPLLRSIGEIQNSNPYTGAESEETSITPDDAPSEVFRLKKNNEGIETSRRQKTAEMQSKELDSWTEFKRRRDVLKAHWDIELPSQEPGYLNPFQSAVPLEDEISDDPEIYAPGSFVKVYNVLYLAASLFEFNTTCILMEAGWPYLAYQAGEIFDVIGEKGELWLAKGHDDSLNKLGWLWSKHFARLTKDDRGEEDEKVEKAPSLPRVRHSRSASTRKSFGF